MVDPITIGAAAKGFEGATSLGVEAAKGAAESAAKSAIDTGAGGMGGGMGGGPANISGGPMPSGFVPDPMGGTPCSVGSGVAEKTGAPQPQDPRSPIQKIGDFLKEHKIGDKVHTISQTQHSLNRFGTDMMGPDAKKFNPETDIHRSTPRWK
ncbi:MAG: hypothetical protein WAW23_12735 [Candidatus Methanoperedens sp.]